MVLGTGLEPVSFSVKGRCPNQLDEPSVFFAVVGNYDIPTLWLTVRCSASELHHHFPICQRTKCINKKKPRTFCCSGFVIYLMIRFLALTNPEQGNILLRWLDVIRAGHWKKISMCENLFHCFILNINCFTKVQQTYMFVKFFLFLFFNFMFRVGLLDYFF